MYCRYTLADITSIRLNRLLLIQVQFVIRKPINYYHYYDYHFLWSIVKKKKKKIDLNTKKVLPSDRINEYNYTLNNRHKF